MADNNNNNNNNNGGNLNSVLYLLEVFKNSDETQMYKVLDHISERLKAEIQPIQSQPSSQDDTTQPQQQLILVPQLTHFEKLADLFEVIWYKIVNASNEFIQKVDMVFKSFMKNILFRLQLEDFHSDNLKTLSLIFSPKYYRTEYRYHNENDDIQSKIAQHEANQFFNDHGIDALLNRISRFKCSFETIKKIIGVIKKIVKNLENNVGMNVKQVQLLIEIVYNKILGSTDEEFKNESKKDLEQIHKYLLEISHEYDQLVEMISQNNLELSLKCFRSPSLEKRNAGLNDIIRYIRYDSIGSRGHQSMMGPYNHHSATGNYGSSSYGSNIGIGGNGSGVSSGKIVEWIKENKLVETLYGETMHIQLLQKCTDILKFLAEQKAFEKRYLDLIWNASEGKHETIENEIYDTVGKIGNYLQVEDIEYLFEKKISKIPYEHYTLHTIKLIQNLIPSNFQIQQMQPSQNGSDNNNNNNSSNNNNSKYIPKGIEIFWNLFQDDCEVNNDIMEQALILLQESLSRFPDLKIFYLNKCLENLKNHTTVILSLRLIYHIITNIQRKKSPTMNNNNISNINDLTNIIEQVNHSSHLVDLLYSQIIYYYDQCKLAIEKLMIDTDENTINDMIIVGKHSHHNHISDYLSFLGFIYSQCPSIKPTNEQINILWNSYIVKGLTSGDRYIFYSFIDKLNSVEDVNIYINLLRLFRTLSFKDIEIQSLNFYMLIMNQIKLLSQNNNQEQNNEPIVGLDDLWKIVLETNNEDAARVSIDFLIEQYGEKNLRLPSEEILNICIGKLAHCQDNLSKSRCLSIIKKYLEDFGSRIAHSFKRHFSPMINVWLNGNKGKFRVDLKSNETIQNVKQLIAIRTNIVNPHTIYLYHNNRLMMDDFESLEDNKVVNGDNISYQDHPENPRVPDPFRSTDIHFEQAHYTTLFSLLNSPDKIAQDVWDLLMLLPVNNKILLEIKTLSTCATGEGDAKNSELNWNQLLDPTSSFKLLYTLMIIDSFINPSNIITGEDQGQDERLIWKQRFIVTGGLQHLLDILMKADLQSESRGSKRKLCISMILGVILSFVSGGDNILSVLSTTGANLSDLVNRLINLIYSQAMSSTIEEDQYPIHETEDATVIGHLMHFMYLLMESNNQLLDVLTQHKDLGKWISLLVLESYDNFIREKVANGIYDISTKISPIKSQPLFLQQLFALLFTTIESKRDIGTCSQYFELLVMLLKNEIEKGKLSEAQMKELLLKLCKMVKTQPIIESTNVYIADYALCGFLSLIKNLIEGNKKLKLVAGIEENLVQEIFHQCLFDIATAENHGPLSPPKCKVKESRDIGFTVLLELAKECQENFKVLTDLLMEHQKPEEKRSLWSYYPAGNEKSTTGYVGLRNLGATCYINSLMQQLFMIPGFRFNILSAEEKYNSPHDQQESLLHQLRVIFSNLQESEKKSFDPKDFCQAYKYDGQPINTNVQMDVDEFFNMLFDKLETTLKGTPQEKLLLDFFGGSNVNQFISQECSHVSEREEPFYTISVEVKNKKEIQESLQLFVESETLDGDNKYFCSTCSQKVKALMRRCVKNLPNNLIIHNKRFEFDLDYLKRTKLNDSFRFPMTLDMAPYTKEFIERKERAEKAKTAGEPIPEELPAHPPGYYQYDLAGIIVHTGTADSGHYYSYIKEREPLVEGQPRRWILFNDQGTELFNPEDINKACFGGYDQISLDQGKTSYRSSPRLNNAYMLFYERSFVQGDLTQKFKEVKPSQASELVPRELFTSVWQKNMKFLNDKNIFDGNYYGFINNIIRLEPVKGTLLDFDQVMQSIELGSRFLIETMFHSKDRKLLPEITAYLIGLFEKHPEGCYWFLKSFIEDPQWIKQNFLVCITIDPREALTKLLLSVIKTILPQERLLYEEFEDDDEDEDDEDDDEDESFEDIEEKLSTSIVQDAEMISIDEENTNNNNSNNTIKHDQKQKVKSQQITSTNDLSDDYFYQDFGRSKSIIIQFMDQFLDFLKDAHMYWKHFNNYFGFIKEFALIGKEERTYLVSRSVIGRLIDFYLGDESPVKYPPSKKTKMGDKFSSPILDKMLDAIAILVCSCRSAADLQNNTREDLLIMPEEDMKLLYNPIFLGKAIRESLSPSAVNDMISHICANDFDISEKFISSVLGLDPCKSGLEVFTTLIRIDDQYKLERMSYIMRDYVHYLDSLLKHRQNYPFFATLIEHATTNQNAGSWFMSNTNEWLCQWLIESDHMDVRSEAFTLIHNLSGLKDYIATGGAANSENLGVSENLLLLFKDLLDFLKLTKKILKREREFRNPKFENYFNLLRLLLCVPGAKEHFAKEWAVEFYKITFDIMVQNIEIDRNRQELMHFIADLIKDSPENMAILSEEQFGKKLMDYFISVSSKDELKQFNQKSLPYFYEVLYHLSSHSNDYLDYVAGNNNFEWANKYLVCECGDYTQVAHFLLKISELVADRRQKHIAKLLSSFLHFENFFYYPANSLELLNILTPTKKEVFHFVQNAGITQVVKFINSNKDPTDNKENFAKALDFLFKIIDIYLAKKENLIVGSTDQVDNSGANYDPQEIFKLQIMKSLITTLFNLLDQNEKVVEKSKKLLNLFSVEAPDLIVAMSIDYQKKKSTSPLVQNNSNLTSATGEFQNLNNNNMLATLQQQHLLSQQVHSSQNENYFMSLLEVLDICSQSPKLTDLSKLSIALCKVIRDLVVCNLELAKISLKRIIVHLNPEEKKNLITLGLSEQQHLLCDDEFFEIIKGFLKEKDEQFILSLCNLLDERISTDIASIHSLQSNQSQDMDKHLQSLCYALKQFELFKDLKESALIDQSLIISIQSLKQFAESCNIQTEKAKQFLIQYSNPKISKK